MTACKMYKCFFHNSGFCERPVPAINECGMCSLWYKHTMTRPITQEDLIYKRQETIVDYEEKERRKKDG